MKMLDTFAGVGGFRLALQNSIGEENVDCIGYSEIDKFAKTVYDYRFPDTPDLGDISKINIDSLPDFDILTGGFPCQDVSVAGKQDLDNGRTVLVEYLLRILENKQPEWFVFENVKGILSNKFEEFFESILDRIKEAGYNVEYKILNTKEHGLPQNRERVFIVGNNSGKDIEYPEKEELNITLQELLMDYEDVDDKYDLTDKNLKHLHRDFGAKGKNIINKKIIPTLTARMGTGGGNVPYLYNHYNNRVMDSISGTLSTSMGFTAKQGMAVMPDARKITPTECERLQGFPDGWTHTPYKHRMMSDTQRYKQMGNAISVPVVQAIFNSILNNN